MKNTNDLLSKIKSNIRVLEKQSAVLYAVIADLHEVKDFNDCGLKRIRDIQSLLVIVNSEALLLIHDLRDDYGSGFKIMKGED